MIWIKRIAIMIGVIFAVFWFGMGYVMKQGEKPTADGTSNYAIVLGAKIVAGGVPTRSLKYRLDAAYDYAINYPHTQLIMSGGQGEDEDMPEAVAMKNYLLKRGIAENRLIVEDQSTSTYENIKYSSVKIPLNEKKITIISNDFHLARAKMIAKNLGFNEVDVVAARTPKPAELKLRTRERAGLVLQRIALWR